MAILCSSQELENHTREIGRQRPKRGTQRRNVQKQPTQKVPDGSQALGATVGPQVKPSQVSRRTRTLRVRHSPTEVELRRGKHRSRTLTQAHCRPRLQEAPRNQSI